MILKHICVFIVLLITNILSAKSQNIAFVNGKVIPSAYAEILIKQMIMQGQSNTSQLRNFIKEELINRELFMQEAEKQGLNNNTDIKNQLEMARQSIIIRALIDNFIKKNPISASDIQTEYIKFKTKTNDDEYHTRHILVEKKEDAQAIIQNIQAGAKFEDMAIQKSRDKISAIRGGDLEWVTLTSFIKPFSDAVSTLKKHEITQVPIHTKFGYHIIKLEDIRKIQIPTLEKIQPQILEILQQKKIQAYKEKLRKMAKIQSN